MGHLTHPNPKGRLTYLDLVPLRLEPLVNLASTDWPNDRFQDLGDALLDADRASLLRALEAPYPCFYPFIPKNQKWLAALAAEGRAAGAA